MPTLKEAIERARFARRCAERLLLDTATTATAIVLCQRFFATRAPCQQQQPDARVLIGACVFLATKGCETPRTLRSVVNVVHSLQNGDSTTPLGAEAPHYANLKNSLINAEQTVLRALRFDVDVTLPHVFLVTYCQETTFQDATVRAAVALVNDALLAPEAVALPACVLAAGCLRIASELTKDPAAAATEGKWWYAYDTSDDDIEDIARILQRVYANLGPTALDRHDTRER